MTVDQLVFVGLNDKVAALDRDSGALAWSWTCPRGTWVTRLVTLLLDGDRLIVAVNGYIYCLDALDGRLLWDNPLKGYGLGIACVTSLRGQTLPSLFNAMAASEQQKQAAQAAHSAGT